MRAMLGAALVYARAEYEVLLDFSTPPQFFEGVCAKVHDVRFDYVVLRPSEAVCAARAACRREGAIADYAPYRGLYAMFDGAGRHLVEDDHDSAATLAKRIKDGLAAGTLLVA
jgi:hypothetical protein